VNLEIENKLIKKICFNLLKGVDHPLISVLSFDEKKGWEGR
jgi:hypothetical protein